MNNDSKMCPFRSNSEREVYCVKEHCELYIDKYSCCALRYQYEKDTKQEMNRDEIAAKFRDIFNGRYR